MSSAVELTPEDEARILERGMSVDYVRDQIRRLTGGNPYVRLARPCIIGDGITQIPAADADRYRRIFEQAAAAGRCGAFVPASGAATRMFKDLACAAGPPSPAVETLLQRLPAFAFYKQLQASVPVAQHLASGDWQAIVAAILGEPGLNLAESPKALIPFHRSPDGLRTPIEEHLREAAAYLRSEDRRVRVHFTVLAAHQAAVRTVVDEVTSRLPDCIFNVELSTQDPATDAIALCDGGPVRSRDGLLFRPAGHGALLGNLAGAAGADIVLIKNIDNVAVTRFQAARVEFGRLIGGCLLNCQQRLFDFLTKLDAAVDAQLLHDVAQFGAETFGIVAPDGISDVATAAYYRRRLNRPVRVCGMVPNAGEPGGGPFWVHGVDGVSPQIVEAAQIDPKDAAQGQILAHATHFNPVIMAVGLRDYAGRPFDLASFRDDDAFIRAEKVMAGQNCAVFELPGLWNGSMGDWNTIFVEAPAEVFSPVKTVFDLLREPHQG